MIWVDRQGNEEPLPTPADDVAPDDDRFVFISGSQASGRLVVVEGFFEELRQRVSN